jgi:hypothetical protein
MDERARTVQAELESAVEAAAELRRPSDRLDRARAARAVDERAVVEAHAGWQRESDDVTALESLSPTRIWASLRGSRDVDLAREQAEEQAAAYVLAQARARREQSRDEEVRALAALQALGDVASRRAAALAAKEAWLRESGGTAGADLARVAEEVGVLRSRRTEILQALAAAARAGACLEQARDVLGSARGWSTADTFFDGGLLTDLAKYSRMDRATDLMRQADAALRELSVELADVGMAELGGIDVPQLTRAFDVWFDNIFSDWSVRNRIGEAIGRTDAAYGAVVEAHRRLSAGAAQVDRDLAALAERRERILLGAASA